MSESTTIARARSVPAREVSVGSHVLYGSSDVGRVTRVEELTAVQPGMVAAVRDGFTTEIYGQPVIKFEIYVHGFDADQTHYFARFPNEPVTVMEG